MGRRRHAPGTPSTMIPELGLIYIGTGNGGPDAQLHRSPGRGDNLFLCSIVALDAKTGAYRWHYQEVPEEDWDYTCTSVHRAGGPHHRWQAAQGADARAQEWLLLCHRPHQWPVHLGEESCARHLDHRHRPGDRPSGNESRGTLRPRSGAGCTRSRRRHTTGSPWPTTRKQDWPISRSTNTGSSMHWIRTSCPSRFDPMAAGAAIRETP